MSVTAAATSTSHDSSSSNDPLVRYEAMRQDGRPIDITTFCASYPQHANLRQRIDAFEQLCADLDELARPVAQPSTASPDCDITLETGAIVGPYRVLGFIGSGGMGWVYLALHEGLGRRCALKVLPEVCTHWVARLQREAQLGARLGHPGVATVFDVGSALGLAYVASEYVMGFPLHHLLRAAGHVTNGSGTEWLAEALREVAFGGAHTVEPLGKPPVEVMVDLACTVADALAHAHMRGVVHRDVKPSNIVVRVSGQPVLIDFGIAVPRTYDSTLTRTGVFVGTYDYAAPEQLLGNWPDLGTWTDTYALGATLFEMLTQRTPFEAASLPDRLALVDRPPPHGPRYFNAAVPRCLDAFVLRALDPDPAVRFHDGEEMAAALRIAANGPKRQLWPATPQIPRRHQRRRPLRTLLQLLGTLALGASLALAATLGTAERMREQFVNERQKAAQMILDLVLPQHRQPLQACVEGEAPLLAGGRRNPRFQATLQLRQSVVVSVQVHRDNDFSWRATRCIVERLKRLRLPGVGLGREERVAVAIDLRL